MSASTARAIPKLREASFKDYPQIALLQADYGMGSASYEEWHHLWAGNPAYVGLRGEWPIGWVLQAGGDIVGYKGNIPIFYELNGKRLIAGCGYSWVVASAYRGYSILLLEQPLNNTLSPRRLNEPGQQNVELEDIGDFDPSRSSSIWHNSLESPVAGAAW